MVVSLAASLLLTSAMIFDGVDPEPLVNWRYFPATAGHSAEAELRDWAKAEILLQARCDLTSGELVVYDLVDPAPPNGPLAISLIVDGKSHAMTTGLSGLYVRGRVPVTATLADEVARSGYVTLWAQYATDYPLLTGRGDGLRQVILGCRRAP